jgi:hypothetical protein
MRGYIIYLLVRSAHKPFDFSRTLSIVVRASRAGGARVLALVI